MLFLASMCVLEDKFVVTPFSSVKSYNFSGSCEIVAIQSCNDTESDVILVTVDYITETSELGAVGVRKDEFMWVSRENGEYFATSGIVDVAADGSFIYPDSNVTVVLSTATETTMISVDHVTIIHNYGGETRIT